MQNYVIIDRGKFPSDWLQKISPRYLWNTSQRLFWTFLVGEHRRSWTYKSKASELRDFTEQKAVRNLLNKPAQQKSLGFSLFQA